MVWTNSDSIALAALLVAVITAILNYYYTRRKTKAAEPEIQISNVKIISEDKISVGKFHEYQRRQGQLLSPYCFKFLLRNTGKKSTLLEIIPTLNILKGIKIIETEREYYIHHKYEIILEADDNVQEIILFNLINHLDWKKGQFKITGTFLDSRNTKQDINFIFEGTNEQEKQWNLVFQLPKSKVLRWLNMVRKSE